MEQEQTELEVTVFPEAIKKRTAWDVICGQLGQSKRIKQWMKQCK